MAHLRISSSALAQRAAGGSPRPPSRERQYLFTQSKWHAIQYVSRIGLDGQSSTVLEAGFVDPNAVFPPYVMRQVEYGIRLGVEVWVTQYVFVGETEPCGVIMSVRAGEKDLGYYAMRLGLRALSDAT